MRRTQNGEDCFLAMIEQDLAGFRPVPGADGVV
jgi:hypothetical protein